MLTNRARYLVQTRGHGTSWQTWHRCDNRDQAIGLAGVLAWRTTNQGFNGAAIPEHAYVRVSYRGSLVYDPRSPQT